MSIDQLYAASWRPIHWSCCSKILCLTLNFFNFSFVVCMWWQAAELLGHPHLQPYILKIHHKINNPRRNTLPANWPDNKYLKKTRFVEPGDYPTSTYRNKRNSFKNDRTLNPSISGAEQDSVCSTLEIDCATEHLNNRLAELCIGDSPEVNKIRKPGVSRSSSISRIPRVTPSKASASPKKQLKFPKNCELERHNVSFAVVFLCFYLSGAGGDRPY